MSETPTPPPQKSSWPQVMRTIGPYMDIGWTFVIAVGGGAWVGYKADAHFGTKPWLLLLGAVFGMVVGFYRFFSVVLRK
jgi:F0F1-type ATP synthase assembly protein I